MKIFAGNSNRLLAEAICNYLNIPLGKASVRRFADQEIFVEIQENVRGEDVFVGVEIMFSAQTRTRPTRPYPESSTAHTPRDPRLKGA